jgi:AcrR family transcriptional regulator
MPNQLGRTPGERLRPRNRFPTDVKLDAVSVLGTPQGDHSQDQANEDRARREQVRDEILDGMLRLNLSGNLDPSADDITKAAGLESGSLFVHFADTEDLQQAAITRQRNRMLPLVAIKSGPETPLMERLVALSEQRTTLFEKYGPLGVVARLKAPFQPVIQDELVRIRTFLRYQLKGLFVTELTAMSTERAETTLTAMDLICSFESYRLMRVEQGLSTDEVTAVVISALTTLLGGQEASA